MKSIILTLILSVSLLSCEIESIPFVSDTPIVANAEGAYSFTLVASDFTENRNDRVVFGGENVQLSITITGYKSGMGQLTITDLNGAVIREESLAQNKVIAQSEIEAPGLSMISLSFENFSGSVVIALADSE